MSDAYVWGTMLGMGAITLLTRLSFIVVWGRVPLPGLALEALRFVPPAVLAAIIVPALLLRDGQLALALDNARLIAGLAAALIAWRTRSALAAIVVGMAALLTLSAL